MAARPVDARRGRRVQRATAIVTVARHPIGGERIQHVQAATRTAAHRDLGRRSGRRRLAAAATAATLVLAGCGDDEPDGPQPGDPIEGEDGTQEPPTEPEDDEPDADADDAHGRDADADDDGERDDIATDDTATDDDAAADPGDEQVQVLAGEPTVDETQEGIDGGGRLAVTDVRVAMHDGFDRVVFELDGEGDVGYWLRYATDGVATSQGSGAPIQTAGNAALEVAIHGVAYPFDLPEGVEPRDGDTVPGPAGGIVTEVADDTIFEGIHLFVVGLEAEHAYLVDVFDDPRRVVVDIVHDG
jgi:hypothetical protein